jgi:hypothetical protein
MRTIFAPVEYSAYRSKLLHTKATAAFCSDARRALDVWRKRNDYCAFSNAKRSQAISYHSIGKNPLKIILVR